MSLKRLFSFVLMMILVAQSFSFANGVSEDVGGRINLSFSHLSPDGRWKCDQGSYFFYDGKHLCSPYAFRPSYITLSEKFSLSRGILNLRHWLRFNTSDTLSINDSIETRNTESLSNISMSIYDFFETTSDSEFLFLGSNQKVKIDNNIFFIPLYSQWLNIKPIFLYSGYHIIEVNSMDTFFTHIVWPFPKGTFFNENGSTKHETTILEILRSEWFVDYNGYSLPKKWADNIRRTATNVLSFIHNYPWILSRRANSPLLSENPQSPGYYCAEGQKRVFARNEDGSYQKVPLCYANITPAKPNKITSWAEIIFDPVTSEPAREKVLRGYVREDWASLLGYKLVDSSANCETLEYEALSAGTTGYSVSLTSESDNGKKLCLKATDALGYITYGSQTMQGIKSDAIAVRQWNPIVSRKGVPINLDDIKAQYVGNANIPFRWSIVHNAQDEGLDAQNPVKWNYRITYTAANASRTSVVTVIRPVEITDADLLQEQLTLASDPARIKDKTQESIDRMLKAKETAQKVFDNNSSSQVEIDKAVVSLSDVLKQMQSVEKNDMSPTPPSDPVSPSLERKPRRRSSGGGSYSQPIEIVKKADSDPLVSKDNRVKEDYWHRKEKLDKDSQKSTKSLDRTKENYRDRKEKMHNSALRDWIFTDSQIFNPTIFDGQCYNRRPLQEIKNSLTLKTSEEFKKSQSFLRSYEMTRYDSIDRFRPKDDLTREEAAKIFSNFAINVLCRKPDMNLKINYRDLENANTTLKQYITTAYQLGIMKGAHGNFRPKDKITKKEISATIIRMILKAYLDETKTSTKTRYSEYEKVAKELWILKKDVNDDPLLREYTALMLFRAYKNQPFSWQKLGYETFALKDRDRFVK